MEHVDDTKYDPFHISVMVVGSAVEAKEFDPKIIGHFVCGETLFDDDFRDVQTFNARCSAHNTISIQL